jgi:hypothetical protein
MALPIRYLLRMQIVLLSQSAQSLTFLNGFQRDPLLEFWLKFSPARHNVFFNEVREYFAVLIFGGTT